MMTKRILVVALIAAGLLFIPTSGSATPGELCTADMIGDLLAHEGLKELVNLVGMAKINITPLKQAINQHQLHQEGPDSQGLMLVNEDEGVTFKPRLFSSLPRPIWYGGFLILIDDGDTHTVLKENAIDDLTDKQFLQTPFLRETAKTAMHELLHAMVFRARCFKGWENGEEDLVSSLEDDISAKVTIHLVLQARDTSGASGLYEKLVADITGKLQQHKPWEKCYRILGLPGPFPGPGFDFVVDFVVINGNILGSGNPNGTANFFDDFDDDSLTASPTSAFSSSSRVSESEGFLNLRSSDGANQVTPGLLVDNFILGQHDDRFLLHDGSGGSDIRAAFRADVPLEAQAYGLQLFTVGTDEVVNVQVENCGTCPCVTGSYTDLPSVTQTVPVNLDGVQQIILRLVLNDATNQVVPSFSTDGGTLFTEIALPASGKVFSSSDQAAVSVFASAKMP